jgi:hypothetical protein
LGHKALAVNLSDLAACGARPLAFTLALSLPRIDETWLQGFSKGLLALADKGDAYHARCVAFFRSNREPLMTTYPVLVECVHLMLRRIGVTKTLAWMDTLAA